MASTMEPTLANSIRVSPTTPLISAMEPPTNVSETDSPTTPVKDCDDIWNQGHSLNGIYKIQPDPTCTSQSSFEVVCDLETNCGGWIVVQRRYDGSVNFYKNWNDYTNGFGSLTGEYWLGLEKLHRLTANGDWKLQIRLEDFYGNTSYAEYTNFSIGDKLTYYRLSFSEYHGSAGNSLKYFKDAPFSTYDKEHDRSRERNCAKDFEGAWWYRYCDTEVNLNGPYIGGPVINTLQAMLWSDWTRKALKKSEMKIRRTYW